MQAAPQHTRAVSLSRAHTTMTGARASIACSSPKLLRYRRHLHLQRQLRRRLQRSSLRALRLTTRAQASARVRMHHGRAGTAWRWHDAAVATGITLGHWVSGHTPSRMQVHLAQFTQPPFLQSSDSPLVASGSQAALARLWCSNPASQRAADGFNALEHALADQNELRAGCLSKRRFRRVCQRGCAAGRRFRRARDQRSQQCECWRMLWITPLYRDRQWSARC